MKLVVIVAASLALVACASSRQDSNTEPTIVKYEGDPPPEYVAACRHLMNVGCSDGRSPSCATVMHRASFLAEVPLGCFSSAASVDEARSCGTPSTVRVRCQ